jgi:hypothetical protein
MADVPDQDCVLNAVSLAYPQDLGICNPTVWVVEEELLFSRVPRLDPPPSELT